MYLYSYLIVNGKRDIVTVSEATAYLSCLFSLLADRLADGLLCYGQK